MDARLIFEALAVGRLAWVGLADRGAGDFDDLVLGLTDGSIEAYQLKTSEHPKAFSLKTLLLGAPNLLGRKLEARRTLEASAAGAEICTIFVCDDFPRNDDKVGPAGRAGSSAGFLEAFAQHRATWTLSEWRASGFGPFVENLQKTSGLGDDEFSRVFRGMRFMPGGIERRQGHQADTLGDLRRIQELASRLPRLVADGAGRDRWTRDELLTALSWRDAFGVRHAHQFPIDAFVQRNAETETALQTALAAKGFGYVSLLGPPGVGKSTLLQSGLLPTPRAVIVRYLAFVPGEGHGLGRAEAFDFLHDLITQLKQGGLGAKVLPGTELHELRAQFESLLREASARFEHTGVRTVFVIDGLDHVPREERPKRSFLAELPLPQVLPKGVIFVLGSQRLDLAAMPPDVRDAAGADGNRIEVAPLPREAIRRWADLAGIPSDVDRDRLYDRTRGHPLSTRYELAALQAAATEEARATWLNSGPSYGGDVEAFYDRAWHELEDQDEARGALAFIALAETPLRAEHLDAIAGTKATDAAWAATKHLLSLDPSGGWSIFHNSFRLYLKAKTGLRFGREDTAAIQQRYGRLADLAKLSADDDPMRWMELRYRARAGDLLAVAALATAERFRIQFISGRNPADIQDDIRFAYQAARKLKDPTLLVALILAQHEIVHRADALGDEVFDAYLALGNLEAANGLLEASGVTLTMGKGYELVDRFLAMGATPQARALFQELEPLAQLCGAELVDPFSDPKELESWAVRVLAFRTPEQVLGSLARLQGGDLAVGTFNIEQFRSRLKLTAIEGELQRNPLLDISALTASLGLDAELAPAVVLSAARFAFDAGELGRAAEHLTQAVKTPALYNDADRVYAAAISLRLGLPAQAEMFIADLASPALAPPTLALDSVDHDGSVFRASVYEVLQHARVIAQLGKAPQPGPSPAKPLMAAFQMHLEAIGRLRGEGLGGRRPHREPQSAFRAALDTLSLATGDRGYDFDRSRIDARLGDVISAMIDAASALGSNVKSALVDLLEKRIAGGGRLAQGHVRRALALKLWREEGDTEAAVRRLQLAPAGVEWTPGEQISEAAQDVAVLAEVGARERALQMLTDMHLHGLGYARAPKKDPQYIFWEELFSRACRADPAGRPGRLSVFGRLLGGMGQTEGRNAGRRLVQPFVEQATQAGPGWATAALTCLEDSGLATWPELASGVTVGVSRAKPGLARVSAQIYGRIGLPWTGDHDKIPLAEFLAICPAEDVRSLGEEALACVETDGHPDVRERLLTEIFDAAALRNEQLDRSCVERWHKPPSGESSTTGDFDSLRAIASLNELEVALKSEKDAVWSACRAFERVAPSADYKALKLLYRREPQFAQDVGAMSAFIRAAVGANATADAVSEMEQLKAKVLEAGGWTNWLGGAARRYFEIDVLIRGMVARIDAFDALGAALAEGREGSENLLPELCSVLELVCETPPWIEAWAALADQFKQFREYSLAVDLVALERDRLDEIETLADLLWRASDIGTTPLSNAVRAVAAELVPQPNGAEVVARLLPKMITGNARVAIDGVQIAWELRDSNIIRDSVLPLLTTLLQSTDYALVDRGADLARAWGQPAPPRRAPLPAGYELHIPESVMSRRFDLPSGISSTAAGLWTEDGASWTFALKWALEFAERSSGINLPVLRSRVAQKMREMGGAEAFGPPAFGRMEERFQRLGLRSGYTKLIPAASFAGMRKVLAELVAAERIDLRAVPFILHETGGYPRRLTTRSPHARPIGVAPAIMASIYGSASSGEWINQVQVDLVEPRYPDFVVLAAVASFRRNHFRDRWAIDRYFGPAASAAGDSLEHQLSMLPRVVFMNEVMPLSSDVAHGGVACVQTGPANAASDPALILCPRLAKMCDLQADLRDPFHYCDRSGATAANTVFWRDGGFPSHDADDGTLGEGCMVIVRQEMYDAAKSRLTESRQLRAWRKTFLNGVRNVGRA